MATTLPSGLRVGIDGYNLAMPHGTGIATYARTLAETLHRGGHGIEGVYGIDAGPDPDLREVLFFEALGKQPEPTLEQRRRAARARLIKALNPWLHLVAPDIPITGRVDLAPLAERWPPFDRLASVKELFQLAMRHFGLHRRFLPLRVANPPAVMHWTYPLPIRLVGARNLYTLHDMVPLKLPYTTLERKAGYRALVSQCAKEGAGICTVSEASRADIIRELGIDPARVTNTWQAAPVAAGTLAEDPSEDAAAVDGIFGLKPRGYFLFVGAIEPKKNIGRMLEAYLSLSTDTPLVIVGGRGWQSEGELTLLPAMGGSEHAHDRALDERVRRLAHLPRGLLLKLMRGARALFFPSLYEGFGLPVLEAMQLGTPVLTANTSSLPEVAGNAALLIDPYDVGAMAAAMRALDEDGNLRSRLSAAGPPQTARFSEGCYLSRLEAMYADTLSRQPA